MHEGTFLCHYFFLTSVYNLKLTLAPKDIDDGAPDVWRRMVKERSGDCFVDLDDISRAQIDRWNTKRANLLHSRMQQEMNAKLEEHILDTEASIPFIKVLVTSDMAENNIGVDMQTEEAMLTIWRPLCDQLDCLQVGTVVRVKNLDTKTRRFDGLKQFSGSHSTQIAILPPCAYSTPTPYISTSNKYSTMFRLQLSSKRLRKDAPRDQRIFELDVLGIVLKVKQRADCQLWIYLTDESNLLLRVQCSEDCRDLDSLLSSFAYDRNDTVVGFRNLRTMPFDFGECCSVAQYRRTSHFLPTPTCQRAHILHQWSKSDGGLNSLQKQALYVAIGVPQTFCLQSNFFKAIGYITGFHVISSWPQLLLHVDCGGPTLLTWRFPLSLISSFAATCDELDDFVVLNFEEEVKITQLTSIGRVFRARQNLYCFTLGSITDSSVDFPGCQFEVSQISAVETSALAVLYSTLLQ